MTVYQKLAPFLVAVVLQSLPAGTQSTAVSFARHGNTIEVAIGGKAFTTYHFDPHTAKAFLEPLRDARGIVITRSFPVGDVVPSEHEHDRSLEPHQRAMYFGHGSFGGYDFWTEEVFAKYYGPDFPKRWGRMVLRKVEKIHGGAASGTIRAQFDLLGWDGKAFAEEIQEYRFSGNDTSRVIDCEFIVRANKGTVEVGDTKEGTFAIRLVPELSVPLGHMGHMVNSEGREGEAHIWGTRSNWVNYDGVISGQELGVAIFDSPKSFRHPTYWHARGYGLFAANPFGIKEFTRDPTQDGSYTIPNGKSLVFRYRVLIHDGDYKEAQVAEKYTEYAHQEQREAEVK
jgi:hypothetical protein